MNSDKISEYGFLSDAAGDSVKNFEIQYAELAAAYRGLDELAHRAKYEVRGGGRNAQQILVALLFGRALTAYEAIYLLASRGMEQDYQALLRTLLDTMFHALAVDNKPENAKAVIWASEHQKKVALQALLEEDKKAKPAGDHSSLEKMVKDLHENIKKAGAKKLSSSEIMIMADVPTWMYQLAYRSLCLSAHPDANRLQKALTLASDNTVIGIEWGPKYGVVEMELTLAMDCLIFVMSCKSLGMPDGMRQEMQAFKTATDQIHRRIASEGDSV